MHRLAPLALMLAPLLLITGCTSTPDPIAETPTAQQVTLDKLGPFPADTAWTDAEREQSLVAASDSYWSRVTLLYPAAERPVVELVTEVSADARSAKLTTCFEDQKINLAGATASEYTPITEADNLSWYTCQVRYPSVPRPPVNDEQLGYIYDYLTGFVAPCLTDLGVDVAEAPTRADFIKLWPKQNWYPSAPLGDDASFSAMNESCPSEAGYAALG